MPLYGLIGYPLSHSFSQRYFTEKFAREGIADAEYQLFPLEDITALPALLAAHPGLRGLNVTIPHKRAVLFYLNGLDESAQKVGAVNVIRITDKGKRLGFNTDYYGFKQSLSNLYQEQFGNNGSAVQALVLGTGGASKAVQAALRELGIAFRLVSREPQAVDLSYDRLDADILRNRRLIINTTPLGMYPNVDKKPPLPYEHLTPHHLCYDLVYNPEETAFMRTSREAGAKTKNGLEMLHLQAEAAWQIWQTGEFKS